MVEIHGHACSFGDSNHATQLNNYYSIRITTWSQAATLKFYLSFLCACMYAGSTVDNPTHYKSQGNDVPIYENEAYNAAQFENRF